MITLYLNHFRGFEDTFVPFDEVSFLVGENSTGKTSVLLALRVLCSHGPWTLGQFQADDEIVGGFDDFASKEVEWFQIGCFRHDAKEDLYDAVLLTFTGQGSIIPFVTDVRLRASASDVRFNCDQELSYERRRPEGTIEDNFREWTRLDPTASEGLSPLGGQGAGTPPPISMVTALHKQEAALYDELKDEQVRVREQWHEEQVKAIRERGVGAPSPPPRPELPAIIRPESLPYSTRWIDSIVWNAPIRAQPRRSYDSVTEAHSAAGAHAPWRLRALSDRATWRAKLRSYGERSGLYDDVEIRKFGDDEDAPFEVRVRFGEQTPNMINVGYGVAQVLPVVTSVLEPSLRGTWFALQQPEVHLHPRAQAALGELLFEMTEAPNDKRFIIETHSDYLVDRFRFKMRTAADGGPRAQVLFFERVGSKNIVHRLPLAPDGEYPETQPDGFRAFFLEQELQNLGY